MIDLGNYLTQGEPDQMERGYVWHTAIGLQQTDRLKTSDYLIETANKNINGDITLEEAQRAIDEYYKVKPAEKEDNTRTEEADKVSARVALILAEKTFSFSPVEYIAIHRRLFEGIYKFAGKIRDYNISKKEWALNGETVFYASAQSIQDTLEYDFKQEREFSYKALSMVQTAEHIARFISGLWQIHAFGEGNTRTTAVFAIKYLRTFGFDVTNDIFAENAWYFRNALVRANYSNLKSGIHATHEHLDRFFANMILGENNELKNRDLLVQPKSNVPVNVPVNPTMRYVFEVIMKNKEITIDEIATQIGKTHKTAQRNVKLLKEIGLIRRVGSDKTGYWEIVNGNESD
jgi:fido (protein-threonine AMPylation protein)